MNTPDNVWPSRRLVDDAGASAVEYGLIASLIAAVIATVVATLGDDILALFESLQWP